MSEDIIRGDGTKETFHVDTLVSEKGVEELKQKISTLEQELATQKHSYKALWNQYNSDLKAWTEPAMAKSLIRLEQRCERYREALEAIKDHVNCNIGNSEDMYATGLKDGHDNCAQIAAEALED